MATTAEQFSELEEERPFVATGDKAIDETIRALRKGVSRMRRGDMESALKIFEAIYKGDSPKVASGLSYYGHCLSAVEGKHREAISLCERAIQERGGDPAHYANLIEVYLLAGRRRPAVKVLEEAMQKFPWNHLLKQVREKMGYRRAPVLTFLSRDHVLNEVLGRLRHRLAK